MFNTRAVPTEIMFVNYSVLQDSYIQSRADTMQNIEQTIVELGGIFQQLATMVKEQEEMVQRFVNYFNAQLVMVFYTCKI